MNRNLVAGLAVVSALTSAAIVVSQGTGRIAQKVLPFGQLRQIQLSRLGEIRLSGDPHLAFAANEAQMFAAGRNYLALVGEDGKTQRRIPTTVANPTIAPMGTGRILIGDKANGILIGLNLADGKSTPLLKLSEITDGSPDQIPSGQMIGDGKLSAVGFDGKNALIALEAGFSSMIFKVDPDTKKIVGRGFAGTPDPSAMTFHDNQIFLLSEEGQAVSRFSSDLVKAQDRLLLPAKGNLGIGFKGGEVRALGGSRTSISRVKADPSAMSLASLAGRLDLVRLIEGLTLTRAQPPASTPMRYAVLICGDLAENFSGECFWNDTVWMFKALMANGFKREDIFVLYGDGADFMSSNPAYQYRVGGVTKKVTNFAATKANVHLVFDGLRNGNLAKGLPKMDGNDKLFMWTFDHGGRGTNPSTGTTDSTLGLRGGSMWAKEFCDKANLIPYESRVIFMQQCYSGGFIPRLANAKTYISTACKADEVARPADNKTKTGAATIENESFGGKVFSHGEFNYHITSALDRKKPLPPGGVVNADIVPPDGFVSALEMHLRNVGQESRPETPMQGGAGTIGTNTKFKK